MTDPTPATPGPLSKPLTDQEHAAMREYTERVHDTVRRGGATTVLEGTIVRLLAAHDALAAEIAALRAERDQFQECIQIARDSRDQMIDERDEAVARAEAAERERDSLAKLADETYAKLQSATNSPAEMVRKFKAALEGVEGG